MPADIIGAITGTTALLGVVASGVVRVLRVGADREGEWRKIVSETLERQHAALERLDRRNDECEERARQSMVEIAAIRTEAIKAASKAARLEMLVAAKLDVTPTEEAYRAIVEGTPS